MVRRSHAQAASVERSTLPRLCRESELDLAAPVLSQIHVSLPRCGTPPARSRVSTCSTPRFEPKLRFSFMGSSVGRHENLGPGLRRSRLRCSGGRDNATFAWRRSPIGGHQRYARVGARREAAPRGSGPATLSPLSLSSRSTSGRGRSIPGRPRSGRCGLRGGRGSTRWTRNRGRARDQRQFGRASHPPQRRFPPERTGSIRLAFLIDDGYWEPAARVLRAYATPMRLKTISDVDGDARVERAITTAKDVDIPAFPARRLSPRVVHRSSGAFHSRIRWSATTRCPQAATACQPRSSASTPRRNVVDADSSIDFSISSA